MDELAQIQEQISELQEKARLILQEKKQAVIVDVREKIKTYGLTARDCGFSSATEKTDVKTKRAIPVKYRQGENVWTGRGKKPKWVVDHIEAGGKLEDLAV